MLPDNKDAHPASGTRSREDMTRNLRLYPEERICARFDDESIAEYPVARRDKMGTRVLDNCAEEHIM